MRTKRSRVLKRGNNLEIKDRTAKKYIAYMKEQRILTQDTSGNYQKGELCHT